MATLTEYYRRGLTTNPKILESRFWSRVKIHPSCWEWVAGKHQGYGYIYWIGHHKRATHVSWFLHHGEWPPPDKILCHTCDNPSCVNPKHLFVGTRRENFLDCVAKGRNRGGGTRGDRNPNTKVSSQDVTQLCALYAMRPGTRRERAALWKQLAAIHNVTPNTIQQLASGKRRCRSH